MCFMKNTTVRLAASFYVVNLMSNTSTMWFTNASKKHDNPLGHANLSIGNGSYMLTFACKVVIGKVYR